MLPPMPQSWVHGLLWPTPDIASTTIRTTTPTTKTAATTVGIGLRFARLAFSRAYRAAYCSWRCRFARYSMYPMSGTLSPLGRFGTVNGDGEAEYHEARDAISKWLAGYGVEPSTDDMATAWTWPPSPLDRFREDEWIRVFSGPGYNCLTPRDDFPLKLYRGTIPEYRLRMSWTTDKDAAVLFARGWIPPAEVAFIYTTEVHSWSDILWDVDALDPGVNRRHHEHEVVITTSVLSTLPIRCEGEVR